MDAQKAMELAAKDEAEDVAMGAAEEEEEEGQQRLEQGPPKAPAKVRRQMGKVEIFTRYFNSVRDFLIQTFLELSLKLIAETFPLHSNVKKPRENKIIILTSFY